jgi:manganese transport protein
VNEPGSCARLRGDFLNTTIALNPPLSSGSTFKSLGTLKQVIAEKTFWIGPAFIASVAYIDPGNFAANITSGAQCGYSLLWVLLWGNVIALLVQTLACRLGIFSGDCLAKNCGKHLPAFVKIPLWLMAEVMSIATDLAEVLGAGIGITLVFHTPLFPSCLLAGILSFLPFLKTKGEQKFLEKMMFMSVVAVAVAFGYELTVVKPDWLTAAHGTIIPTLHSSSMLIAASMLGATVMPHVIFLHSGLMKGVDQQMEPKRRYRLAIADNFIALNFAWIINSAMVITFAAAYKGGCLGSPSIESASHLLTPMFGNLAALIFGSALIIAGLGSTTVGSMAGQVILDGFLNVRIPVMARRALTLVPCLLIIQTGIDSTKLLVFSQAALCIALPFTIVPLIWLNASAKVLGQNRITGKMLYASIVAVCCVVALNVSFVSSLFCSNSQNQVQEK